MGLSFKIGARGFLIERLQRGLRAASDEGRLDIELDIDGDFGGQTARAINQVKGYLNGRGTTGPMPIDGQADQALFEALGLAWPDDFERAIELTALFEGTGFERAEGPIDTGDDAGVTYGVIGFTSYNGELQELLREVLCSDAVAAGGADYAAVRAAMMALGEREYEVMLETLKPGAGNREFERWAFVKEGLGARVQGSGKAKTESSRRGAEAQRKSESIGGLATLDESARERRYFARHAKPDGKLKAAQDSVRKCVKDFLRALGQTDSMRNAQLDRARKIYWGIAERQAKLLLEQEQTEGTEKSESELSHSIARGLALMFDIAVQNGGLRDAEVYWLMRQDGWKDKAVQARMWDVVNALRARLRSAGRPDKIIADVMSRKSAIVAGGGIVHGDRYDVGSFAL